MPSSHNKKKAHEFKSWAFLLGPLSPKGGTTK